MCFDTFDTSISITLNAAARYDWGDGQRDVASYSVSHSYSDGIAEHTFCVELLEDWSAPTLLYLNNNALTSLPPEIGNLSSVTTLNVHFNALTSLPGQLGNMASLGTLRIYGNDLTSLPPELGNSSSLYRIEADSNDLTSLPPELGSLPLSKLIVSNNALTTVPYEIGQIASLSDLRLHGNSISTIPANIAALTNLEILFLHANSFSQAELSAFVNEMWQNRATHGANSLWLRIDNNNGLTATAIDQIEGTGSYVGDGLVQAGCFVTY
jgi:hypothetical protein